MSTALGDHLDEDEKLVLDLFLEEFQPQNAKERWAIGVYVSAIFLEPKECRSRVKLAAYTDRSRQYIDQIENRGIRKLRNWKCFEREDMLCAALACQDYKVEM